MKYFAVLPLLFANSYAAADRSGSSAYWPTLASQCSTALNILSALNVTYKMPNSNTCCYSGDDANAVGNFPVAGTSEKGVYIGCSVDGNNRQFVSAMYIYLTQVRQVNSERGCFSQFWPSFSGLPGLSVLTIKSCYLSGVWVDWSNLLTQAGGLAVLSLKGNSLVGNLPASIPMFSKLRYLDLSQNYFSDVIPSNIYEMGTLEHLYLNGNMLTGIIPWGIGQLKSLISLDLSSNFMVGPLPDMISMAKLKTCSVSSDICIVRNEDVPSICTKNLQLCSAVASSNGNGWFPGVSKNIATSGSRGTPFSTSMGIGIGIGTIVTFSLGILLFFMERKEKTTDPSSEPKEPTRQWYQFDDMNQFHPERDEKDLNLNLSPQDSSDTIPALVIEE